MFRDCCMRRSNVSFQLQRENGDLPKVPEGAFIQTKTRFRFPLSTSYELNLFPANRTSTFCSMLQNKQTKKEQTMPTICQERVKYPKITAKLLMKILKPLNPSSNWGKGLVFNKSYRKMFSYFILL